MLSDDEISKLMLEVINDQSHGMEYYNCNTLQELKIFLKNLLTTLDEQIKNGEQPTDVINNYLKNHSKTRREYFDKSSLNNDVFDKDELIYRTAYGALVKGEAICTGFTEATRILLNLYNIKSITVLAKLREENKIFLHYLCVARLGEKIVIVDPYVEGGCKIRKIDYIPYLHDMRFMLPDDNFYNNKVGKTGFGITAPEYLKLPTTVCFDNYEDMMKVMEKKIK